MSSKEFYVIAILKPKKGKADRVVELLQGVSKWVKENEPGTLRYEVTRDLRPGKDGNEDIVMIERYSDQGALKAHGTSKPFTAFQKQLGEEGLMRGKMEIKMVSERAGFASRL